MMDDRSNTKVVPAMHSRHGARRELHRLHGCRSGATMVEFAVIALPFLLVLLATFELGFVYWATAELENATDHGARMVRTGQVQLADMNQAQLKSQICGQTAVLVACPTRLRLDVRSARTFPELTPPAPLNGGGGLKNDADFTFSPGAANDVVLVSAFYNWTPLMKPSDHILRAAAVIRNEPF